MNRIPQSFIQDLLTRTDIVEITKSRLSLTKRGNNYVGKCPFHQEKTPSFTVSANKQFYYCFGCQAHGNAITFLMQFDRMEFIDVIHYLVVQAGMEIPKEFESPAENSFQDLYKMMEKVSHYYQKQLSQNKRAIQYLQLRNVTGKTAKIFEIGFALPQWNNLSSYFNHDPKLIANGLLIAHSKNPEKYYDRFRDRIMFPIRDVRGRYIGFGGRSLAEDNQPKYLNSPETPIFHKGDELYGLYEARKIESNPKKILIVEGYMDVISLAEHGIHYSVATLGTATSRMHIQKLLRYTSQLIFCFDGDTAGNQAAWKALLLALPLLRDGVHIAFLFLPNQEDPDSLIRKIGKTAFEEKIQRAHSLETVFFTKFIREIPVDRLEGKAHFAKEVCQLLDDMPNGLYKKLMFEKVAEILKINSEDLESLRKTSQEPKSSSPATQKYPSKKLTSSHIRQPVLMAIALLLQQPTLIEYVKDLNLLSRYHSPERDLFVQLCEIFRKNNSQNVGHLLSTWKDPEESQWIAELSARPLPFPPDSYAAEFRGAIVRLEQQTRDQMAKELIHQAKLRNLTDDEKRLMLLLLENKTHQELD